MVIFVDGKPVKTVVKPTSAGASSFDDGQREDTRFNSRPRPSRAARALTRKRQTASDQRANNDRFVTVMMRRTDGTRPIHEATKKDSVNHGNQHVMKRDGMNRSTHRPMGLTRAVRKATVLRHQRIAAGNDPSTFTPLVRRSNRRYSGRQRSNGSDGGGGNGGGMRGRRRTLLSKNALDQQLNKYFSADPTMYKGQLDRELDEIMQDTSNGQTQQNI